jgi:hypothetical protein
VPTLTTNRVTNRNFYRKANFPLWTVCNSELETHTAWCSGVFVLLGYNFILHFSPFLCWPVLVMSLISEQGWVYVNLNFVVMRSFHCHTSHEVLRNTVPAKVLAVGIAMLSTEYNQKTGICTIYLKVIYSQGDDDHRLHDGSSKHLWNVGKLMPDYIAQPPRRQSSSA